MFKSFPDLNNMYSKVQVHNVSSKEKELDFRALSDGLEQIKYSV